MVSLKLYKLSISIGGQNHGQLFSLEDELIDCWYTGQDLKAKSFMWLFILVKITKLQAAAQ